MNKHKKIKKLFCFLLAFVVMASTPLNLQANALVIESWMVYALITYMAAMGITFTVAGGVDAMIQAMEEKVKDYEDANNIIDFYEVLRNRNVRLVPSNNHGPNGNPLFDLFFTAVAVEGIQAFVNWLTSDGGWNKGTSQEYLLNDVFYDVNSFGVSDMYKFSVIEGTDNENYNMIKEGTLIPFEQFNLNQKASDNNSFEFVGYDATTVKEAYWIAKFFGREYYSIRKYTINKATGKITEDDGKFLNSAYSELPFDYVTYAYTPDYTGDYRCAIFVHDVTNDKWLEVGYSFYAYPNNGTYFSLNTSVDIMTPEEFQEQFPSVDQGVSIKDAISVPMGEPTLIEWAQRVEETFDLTGTIPQPVPEVITDPDFAPVPTPVPTPAPTPEIEDVGDLGLPTLGEAIFSKFPFSLPKDLKRISDILNAEPVTPKWEVDLYETLGDRVPFRGSTKLTIDLEEYEELGQISRWASVITFVVFLIIITKGVIRW